MPISDGYDACKKILSIYQDDEKLLCFYKKDNMLNL
jgi:hypothetical protein